MGFTPSIVIEQGLRSRIRMRVLNEATLLWEKVARNGTIAWRLLNVSNDMQFREIVVGGRVIPRPYEY